MSGTTMWIRLLERAVVGRRPLGAQEQTVLMEAIRSFSALSTATGSHRLPADGTGFSRPTGRCHQLMAVSPDSSRIVHSHKRVSRPLSLAAGRSTTTLFIVRRSGTLSGIVNQENQPSDDSAGNEPDAEQESIYPVKRVSITTCGPLYRKWHAERRPGYSHRRVPLDGIQCEVEYADTMPQLDLVAGSRSGTDRPTVLALHGAPGSHECFSPLIRHLTRERNARVIAPNFPTYKLTEETNIFRHSAYEKTEFLKDFLRAIDVNRIDMVVAHSSALFPTLLLHEDPDGPEMASYVLINPAGHRLIKAMRPAWFTYGATSIYFNPILRRAFRLFGTKFLIAVRAAVDPNNLDNLFLSASSMKHAHYENVERQLKLLRNTRVPLTYIFGNRDNLVDREIFREMATMSGATDAHYDTYNNGDLVSSATVTDPLLRVVAFQDGGHYAFKKYTDIVKPIVTDHLDRVMSMKPATATGTAVESSRPVTDPIQDHQDDLLLGNKYSDPVTDSDLEPQMVSVGQNPMRNAVKAKY